MLSPSVIGFSTLRSSSFTEWGASECRGLRERHGVGMGHGVGHGMGGGVQWGMGKTHALLTLLSAGCNRTSSFFIASMIHLNTTSEDWVKDYTASTPHTRPHPTYTRPHPPTQGHTPPTQGHTPPTQGRTPPTQGHTPPTQGRTQFVSLAFRRTREGRGGPGNPGRL